MTDPNLDPAQRGSVWEWKCTRRQGLKYAAVLAAGLLGLAAGCAPPTIEPPTPPLTQPTKEPPTPTLKPTIAPNATPTNTPVPKEEPTAEPIEEPTLEPTKEVPLPVPTVEGPTIQGETLAIGGTNLELRQVSGEQIAESVGAREKNWLIVTDENGNSSFFVGYAGAKGKEVQMAVLAQGPQAYQWNETTMTWQQNGHVVVPDILLPGGWNEEKNMAGPAHEAETVFLFRDDGSYRVGVLYSPEVVAQISDKSNLEILPDGRGLYVGVQKNFDLQIGQNIVRDNDDNLRLVDPSGNYFLMITSWENVTSPDQLYQAGSFAGPLQSIPELPYPPQSLVGENYGGVGQLEDGTVVAKDGKNDKLIIAKATYNPQKKQWEWIKTIPFEEITGLPYPNEAMVQDAYNKFKLENPVVAEQLKFEVKPNLNDPNKTSIVFGRDPTTNKIVLATRMSQQTKELEWHVAGLRDLGDALRIRIGAILSNTDIPYSVRNKIDQPVVDNYNAAIILWTSWPRSEPELGKFRFDEADAAIALAENNDMTVRGDHLVYGYSNFKWTYLKELQSQLTRDELANIMKRHIAEVMAHFKGKVDLWTVVNEARPPSETNPEETGPYDPFWAIIGPDYVDIAFETARDTNPNAILIYNECRNHQSSGLDGRLTDSTKTIVNRLAAKRLIDGVGIQMELDGSRPLDIPDLIQTLRSYGLPVYITELYIDMSKVQGTPEEKLRIEAEIYGNALQAILDSGVCKDVYFFEDYALFDPNTLEPTPSYLTAKDTLEKQLK